MINNGSLNLLGYTHSLNTKVADTDVERNNITDGKEINGYVVKIITGWDKDGTPIVK